MVAVGIDDSCGLASLGGARAPTQSISPCANRGLVDRAVTDMAAILKRIETRYGLASPATCGAASPDLTEAFDVWR